MAAPQKCMKTSPGESSKDDTRKRKKRRLNRYFIEETQAKEMLAIEYEGLKDSNHLEQIPSDKKKESTGNVIPSRRKASRRKAEMQEEYNLVWFKLWWRRTEREGEQEYKNKRLELSSSSNLMYKFLVRGKNEISKTELFKDKLSDKNLTGSAAECTSHQNFGVGVKWGFSEKESIIQGSEDALLRGEK